MQNNPKPFEIYRHFKGNCYQILTLAESSEDGTMQVVYQGLYSPFKISVRPLDMFLSAVDKAKYPEAKQEFRFELIKAVEVQPITKTESVAVEEVVHEDLDDDVIDPMLMKFLDADTYEEKLNILVGLHSRINQDMINTIAVALDIEVNEGNLEERYDAIKNCLITFEKYECNRLR